MTDDAKLPSTRKALHEAARQAEKSPPTRQQGAAGECHPQTTDVRETLAALRKLLAVRGS